MNDMVLHNKNIHFIANSPYTASTIKKKYNINAPIIPNSIKDSFIKKSEHIPPKDIRILCISSSNDKRKNIITLLYAFKKFTYKYPKSTLQLIGSPFVKTNTIIQNWEKENLLNNVILTGQIEHDELIQYIDNCSIFITPSLEETFGNTILESIVRRVPVIGGSNSGAVPYVLHNGKAGYLCDVSDSEDILKTLEHIILNPQEARRKAEEAYNITLSEYCENVVCQSHIHLYQKFTK